MQSMQVYKKAVYAGSFDPLTNGHLWIIQKAAQLFDELVVAIGDNYDKNYTFSLDERVDFIKQAVNIGGFANVSVAYFHNEFLVNFTQQVSANFMVRGIRNSDDYEYERVMRHINYDLNSNIETIFLLPPRRYAEVSSSLVKSLVGANGWQEIVSQYVPRVVLHALDKLATKNQQFTTNNQQ